MDETRADLLMRVEGMTCDGCAAAVTRTVKRVDPAADVRTTRKQYRADEHLVMKIESFDPVTGAFTARSV